MLEKDPVTRPAVPGQPTRPVPLALSGTARDDTTDGHPADGATGQTMSRVELLRVLTGLRHLRASTEPGRVFSELAGVCVPALCDEVIITIEEAGGHRYRIRQPANTPSGIPETPDSAATQQVSDQTSNNSQATGGPGPVGPIRITAEMVQATVTSVSGGGPDYTATVVCSWHTGYLPTDADVALVGVLAEHAAGVVNRERTMGTSTGAATARQIGVALDGAQRIAAATGVLMALHHLTVAQARQLLDRASNRTHRSLQQVADTVLRTGSLTEPRHKQDDTTAADEVKPGGE